MTWIARELCPTRSVRTETSVPRPTGLYPHRLAEGVYLCGHNARSSYGAHAYFIQRPDGKRGAAGGRHLSLHGRQPVLVAGRWGLHAFPDVCWYSWPRQTQSLAGLAAHRFAQVFPGHGIWSPRLDPEVMRQHLLALVERM